MEANTICAISTAPGVGGIAVIRVSGPDALTITDKIFKPLNKGVTLKEAANKTVWYGDVYSEEGVLDTVLVSVFRNPHSFTGEDTTEISCHGSLYIQQQILRLLLKNGCVMAQPGESHRLALQQMKGGISDELQTLRVRLLDFVSLIELELDFSTEDVEFADREKLNELVQTIRNRISKLCDSFALGNAIKNGVPVAIIGQTNVGKSTLLNCILNEEKAIVSDVRGTTRDVIEDVFVYGGIQFRLIDTAGLRETADVVEKLGIERSYKTMDEASVVLLVCDSTDSVPNTESFIRASMERVKGKNVVLVFNKSDIIDAGKRAELMSIEVEEDVKKVFISAKLKDNVNELLDCMLSFCQTDKLAEDSVIISNMRHYESLQKAQIAIGRVEEGLNLGLPSDLLTRDIHDCIDALGEITGQISSQDVLNNIFSKFCIGK